MSETILENEVMPIDDTQATSTASTTPVGTRIQLKTKTSPATGEGAVALDTISLYRGEPLYNTNNDRLYIGSADTTTPDTAKTAFYNTADVDAMFNSYDNTKATIKVEKTSRTADNNDRGEAFVTLTSHAIEHADGIIAIAGALPDAADNGVGGLVITRPAAPTGTETNNRGSVTIGVDAGSNIVVGNQVNLDANPKVTSLGVGAEVAQGTTPDSAPVTLQYDDTLKALKFVFN